MSPKDGTPGIAVSPTEPKEALEADSADPGEVETTKGRQRQTKSGKYGSVPVQPYKPPKTDEDKKKKKSWIEIYLHDEKGKAIPGEAYTLTLPDNTVSSGTLDEKGCARIEGIEPGQCKVSFPNLEDAQWSKG